MAIAQVAASVGQKVVQYAPAVYEKSKELVSKATSGRVKTLEDIKSYVGNDARKLSVVTGALAAAGIRPDDLVPADIAATNPQLAQIRATIEKLATNMRSQYDAGSDRLVAADDADTARDVLRRQRVEAVLRVYGTPETYFLCHPNGGVARADFAWYKAMRFRG